MQLVLPVPQRPVRMEMRVHLSFERAPALYLLALIITRRQLLRDINFFFEKIAMKAALPFVIFPNERIKFTRALIMLEINLGPSGRVDNVDSTPPLFLFIF